LLTILPLTLPAFGVQMGDETESQIEIKTEEVRDCFDYQGSTLAGTVKASITSKQSADSPSTQYEDLWFHGWGAIGCRRYSEQLSCDGKSATIRLCPNERSSQAQIQASSNAALRILLDLYAQGTTVTYILVPDDQFAISLANELRRVGISETAPAIPDQMVECGLTIVVKAEESGKLYTLCQGTMN
jgi:hypothetical protein